MRTIVNLCAACCRRRRRKPTSIFNLSLLQRGQVDERPAEQQVEEMSQNMRRLMHAKPEPVRRFLLDTAVELGCKVPNYALLVGKCRRP